MIAFTHASFCLFWLYWNNVTARNCFLWRFLELMMNCRFNTVWFSQTKTPVKLPNKGNSAGVLDCYIFQNCYFLSFFRNAPATTFAGCSQFRLFSETNWKICSFESGSDKISSLNAVNKLTNENITRSRTNAFAQFSTLPENINTLTTDQCNPQAHRAWTFA